jgi:glucose dehydrogenase
MRASAAASITLFLCSAVVAPGVRGAPAAAAAGEDGQWPMPAKDYASTRYSKLPDITPQNAPGLHPVWTFSTGVLGGHEGQPLVVGDTMYVVTPWPNVLYAFDLTKEGYPLRWKYRPEVSANAIGVSCCDVVNRGAFYVDGKIVYNLLDGHTVAVDAKSGRSCGRRRSRTSPTGDRDDGAVGGEGARAGRCRGRGVRHLQAGSRPST